MRQVPRAPIVAACALLLPSALPAITIDIRYDYDTGGFFEDPAARATAEAAAAFYSDILTDDFAPVTSNPSTLDNYEITFGNPSDSSFVSLPYSNLEADTVRIYVGAQNLGSSLGYGGPGGSSVSGSADFQALANTRGEDFDAGPEIALWGGTVTVNNREFFYDVGAIQIPFWSLDHTVEPERFEQDLYSTLLHEIAHVLGLGTADSYFDQVNRADDTFIGSRATYFNGGNPVPLSNTAGDENLHTATNALETALHPYADAGAGTQPSAFLANRGSETRHHLTLLDTAILDDIGWDVNYIIAVPEPGTTLLLLSGLGFLAMRRSRA